MLKRCFGILGNSGGCFGIITDALDCQTILENFLRMLGIL